MVSFPQNRHRERNLGTETGFITISGTRVPQTRLNERWVCDDVIGNKGGENNLTLYKKRTFGGLITDPLGAGIYFDHVPMDFGGASPNPSIQLGMPSLGSYANRIMAQSGPRTAAINLPVALFELKDIPKMLKHAGDLLHGIATNPRALSPAKEAASATLAAQFGWLPLIGDIRKLMDLSKIIANRQKILQGAHSVKGIRRKVTLDSKSSGTGYSGSFTSWSTYGRTVQPTFTQMVESETWGVCHWRVRNPALIGRPPDFQDAFYDALGLSKGYIPISVWKAMPWSWAFDWFAGISDLINAGHNYIDYEPFKISAMRTSKSYVTTAMIQTFHTVTTGFKQETWKERQILVPVPWFNIRLPFMDSFKSSILGSFAILALYQNSR